MSRDSQFAVDPDIFPEPGEMFEPRAGGPAMPWDKLRDLSRGGFLKESPGVVNHEDSAYRFDAMTMATGTTFMPVTGTSAYLGDDSYLSSMTSL